jgi:predicted nucleotidyltransferase
MSDQRSVGSRDLELAREFARRLAGATAGRRFVVTLFGSRARGEADEESDLDLFVALDDPDPQGSVREAALQVACDLTLESGILISAFLADPEFVRRRKDYSFLRTVEDEGIRL